MTARNRHSPFLPLWGATLLLMGCADGAFFQPEPVVAETPASYRLAFTEVSFPSRDGTPLSGWFIPARGPAAGTILHLHGSYGNQGHALPQVQWLPVQGLNVLTFDYRGYGRSGGKPSRRGAYEDALAALAYLGQKPGIDPEKIAVFGQSLGRALAIAAAADHPSPRLRAVASEGAFDSYRSQARERMLAATRQTVGDLPWLAQQTRLVSRLAVSDTYGAGQAIHRLAPAPVLLIHGRQDALVSPGHAERLFAAARDPKALWIIEQCGHLEAFTAAPSHRANRQRLAAFLRQALQEPKTK